VATYLDRILDAHRSRAADDPRPVAALVESARRCPPPRPFADSLRQASGSPGALAVIAEIKRRSPAKGALNPDLDPEAVAKAYQAGGAAALSVVTDREFFGGSPADLAAARDATTLPVLRKDFTVSALDVCDARLMGADCVLLIVAALTQPELLELYRVAQEVGLDALVEVHDEPELERALKVGADLIGVNQRDLVTFAVDQRRAARMAPLIPEGAVRVAESGVRGPADARELYDAGYHAVLVGEGLVTAPDPESAVRGMAQMTELTGGS
jgi:indole-3-glycerol phosphate synthase